MFHLHPVQRLVSMSADSENLQMTMGWAFFSWYPITGFPVIEGSCFDSLHYPQADSQQHPNGERDTPSIHLLSSHSGCCS